MRTKRNSKILLTAVFLALAALIVCAVILIAGSFRKKEEALLHGVRYIQEQEGRPATGIERQILESRKEAEEEEEAEQEPVFVNGENIWALMYEHSFVIAGDSRVRDFARLEYLDDAHVLAENGANITMLYNYYDWLAVRNPEIFVISFGINDIDCNPDISWFLPELTAIMEDLAGIIPDTTIYIQSIFPATEVGMRIDPKLENIPEWNRVLRETCGQMGWNFLNMDDFMYSHWDLFDEDGTHFLPEFYPLWAEEIFIRYLRDKGIPYVWE